MLNISKEELKRIYYENTNKVALKKLGISTPTLLRYLKMSGIEPKGMGNRSGSRRKIQIVK